MIGASLGFASETEVVLIGQESWGRERGGTWEAGAQYSLVTLASPRFYIDSLHFDALRLSSAGPVEVVNGVEAYPVRLDKDDVLGLLTQATAFGLVPDTDERAMERATEDAAAWLPDDFTVETWIAVDGTYPVRLEIRMSGGSEGFAFIESAESVRLEMDITDVNVDVQGDPPTPIARDLE